MTTSVRVTFPGDNDNLGLITSEQYYRVKYVSYWVSRWAKSQLEGQKALAVRVYPNYYSTDKKKSLGLKIPYRT